VSSYAELRNPVGTHVPVGRGLATGLLPRAATLEAETVQVFVGNPRGWALSAGAPAEDLAFREACRGSGMRVFVHTPYLVNLGSPTDATYQRSLATVAHNLRRAVQIGAEGVVVHTGSCVDEGYVDTAMRQVREGLLPLLDVLGDDGPSLLLEPTAGQGRSLCAGVTDLAEYVANLDHHPRAGVCLDTCHAYAAGAPLDEPGGPTETVDRVLEAAPLRLVHANDSKDPRGSMRDRHEVLGDGHIGLEAFEELLAHPAMTGVPLILETPGSRDVGDPQIPLLKKLRP
jgi:deoxyribonuclease-4